MVGVAGFLGVVADRASVGRSTRVGLSRRCSFRANVLSMFVLARVYCNIRASRRGGAGRGGELAVVAGHGGVAQPRFLRGRPVDWNFMLERPLDFLTRSLDDGESR